MGKLSAFVLAVCMALPAIAAGPVSASLSGSTVIASSPAFQTVSTPMRMWDLSGTMTGTPGVLTVPTTGIWEVDGFISFGFSTLPKPNGYVAVEVVRADGQNVAQGSGINIPNTFTAVSFSQKVFLSSGTTYHMAVTNDTGVAATVYRKFSLTLVQ